MQVNKIETTKKVSILDAQKDALRKQKARYEITDREVTNLGTDTRVYAACGRMFVLSTVPDLKTELNDKIEKVESVIQSCDKNKDFLLKNLREQEDSLRELVKSKK
jgi:prefoldin subunit 1